MSQCLSQVNCMTFVGPITSLQFINEYLLAGEGPFLNLYDSKFGKSVLQVRIFADSRIYGISIYRHAYCGRHLICVYGGKQLRTVEFHEEKCLIGFVSGVLTLPDHIWEVVWLHSKSSEEYYHATTRENSHQLLDPNWRSYVKGKLSLACVLGHNSVRHLQEDCEDREVHCVEKCIIYCARSVGENWQDLLVASGTVFNQIVLWRPSHLQACDGRAPVLHRLIGHQGVIFSIAFNVEKGIIASASDDRSIRIWQSYGPLTHDNTPDENKQLANTYRSEELRQGNEDDQSVTFGDSVQYELVQTMYGHTARVWDVIPLNDVIISVSEDATCLVWSYTGTILKKFKGHKGTNIWSLVLKKNADKKLIATGGGDASIRLWSLQNKDIEKPFSVEVLEPHVGLDDQPRTVCILEDTCLAMMNSGKLMAYANGQWSVRFDDPKYSSYTVLACNEHQPFIAMGNIHGQVTLLFKDFKLSSDVYSGKVFSMLWCQGEDNHNSLLTTGPEGKLDLWSVNVNEKEDGIDFEHQAVLTLPPGKQRWVSAAAIFMTSHGRFLVCGDRGGSLHLYSIDVKEQTMAQEPLQSLWKIHGKTGVTDVCYIDNQVYTTGRDGQYRTYHIVEGKLTMLSANRVLKGFDWLARLLVVNSNLIILGFYTDKFIGYNVDTGEQVLEVQCGGGHRAWNFRLQDTHAHLGFSFVYIKQQNVVQCRGSLFSCQQIIKPPFHGKEACDVKHLFSDEKRHVLVTASEDTTVNIVAVTNEFCGYETLATIKGHLSSVRTISISGMIGVDLTRGESETEVMIDATDVSRTCVMFSAGGRGEIKAWRIHRSIQKTAANVQISGKDQILKPEDIAKLKTDSAMHEGKIWHEYLGTHSITGRFRLQYKPWKHKNWDPDPESRYMDLTSFAMSDFDSEAPDYLYCVIAACSDGFVRMFSFNTNTRRFQIIAQSDIHDHCVLKATHFILPSAVQDTRLPQRSPVPHECTSDGKSTKSRDTCCVYVLTVGTDGRIAFWEITDLVQACIDVEKNGIDDELSNEVSKMDSLKNSIDIGEIVLLEEPILFVKAHQSGINALHFRIAPGTNGQQILIGTGGDDNAIALTLIEKKANENGKSDDKWAVKKQSSVLSAHATQITGLRILDLSTLLTTSIDQRLTLWRIANETMQTTMICSKILNVADISNMDVWPNPDEAGSWICAVAGVGLQIVQLSWPTLQ